MSSPGNNSIALGVQPPATPAAANPLAMAGEIADIRSRYAQIAQTHANTANAINAARQFQQEFQAKQKAGEIISHAPDMDAAMQQMKSDPTIAGFLPEIINSYQGLQQLSAQTQGAQQANSTNALHEVMQAIPSAMTDEASFDKAMSSRLGAVPKPIRDGIQDSVSSLRSALFDGLSGDGQARAGEYARRWNSMMLGAGFTPQIISGIAGQAENMSTGGANIPVVRMPGVLGGQVAAAPGAIPNTLAPTLSSTPSGAAVPVGGAYGVGGGEGANPLVPQQVAAKPAASAAAAIRGAPGAPATQKYSEGPMTVPLDNHVVGGAGPQDAAKYLAAMLPPIVKGANGIPVQNQPEATQAADMMKNFSEGGVREYGAAQQSLGYLKQMDSDLDTLAKGGGALTPGGAAQWRLKLAQGANTISQALGGKPVVDPSKVAAGEAANKITNTLGFNLVNQFLGGQREAFGTIEKGIQSVPGIENSYLGGKLLVESLRQTAQRAIDQRKFQQSWSDARGGNLAGSVEAFNDAFPPEAYADRALSKYGMTEKGFGDKNSVKAAVAQGYLTKDQGVKILTSQFGMK